jgi:hypothetical protein
MTAFSTSSVSEVLGSADLALVACVTLHPRPADRSMSRDGLHGVQVFLDGEWHRHPDLASLGERGMNSIARLPDGAGWVCCTGFELFRYNPSVRDVTRIHVADLDDAHDIMVEDGVLHLANTGSDELVTISLDDWAEVHRAPVPMARRPHSLSRFIPEVPPGSLIQAQDRFHFNQVFRGVDGDLWGVVHNVDGRQVLYHKLGEILKAHGNGGVVNLGSGESVALGLSSPHSIRVLDDTYVVFDSGAGCGRVFTHDWAEVRTFETVAWGRGADRSPDGKWLAVGMSPIRKRYAGRIPYVSAILNPSVELFDTSHYRSHGSVEIPGCEQVYDVHFVSRAEAEEMTEPTATPLDYCHEISPARSGQPQQIIAPASG